MNSNIAKIANNDILHKYAEAYVLRRKKSGEDNELTDIKKRYVIYARKSTEDDKRQVQSIDDQIQHCKEYARNNNLEIVEVIREEKSAKVAGKRQNFQLVLETIQHGGLYNSILAWHPDRLARNMKESGEILDLLDKGVIADLKFASCSFVNDTAGKMTLSILFAMAKEFSDKLSDDTKRGITKKVLEGKYCGNEKRGYYHNKDGFFRKDKETFEIYKDAWKKYKEGFSQESILGELKEKDESLTTSKLSAFFKDPFYAGLYCYGRVVDIKSVDPDFEAMISAEDFLAVQRENKLNPRGWKTSNNMKPFARLVKCADCGSYMVPGVSNGRGGKYLSLTCGNGKCRKSRREQGIKPIANTIRGNEIVKAAINFLQSNLDVEEPLYLETRESYFESKNVKIHENKERLRALRIKLSNKKDSEEMINKKFLKEQDETVARKLSNDLGITIKERESIEKSIAELELQTSQFEYDLHLQFPPFNEFVNFFKKVLTVLQETHDAELLDNLVKLLFVNIIVGGKEVLAYDVREPFNSYQIQKFLHGVEDGT